MLIVVKLEYDRIKEKLGFKIMNIQLLNKKINEINDSIEVVVLKTTKYLEKSENKLLDNIFF